MEVLDVDSYNTLFVLESEEYHERKLKKWWGSFSRGEQALIRQLIGDATALLHTTLDWHLLEVITSYWDPAPIHVTIGDVDLVHNLEEYDHFLSLSTLVSSVFIPLVRTHYCKRLANLMGFKRLVVEALT